jgi:4-amino-4-deoxy-L-arabinose transferase-like glycosyltransferase
MTYNLVGMTMSRIKTLIAESQWLSIAFPICLVGLIAFAASMPNSPALWPQGRDNGVFAYVGLVTRYGGTPYVDAWDHKSPAIFFYYALGFLLFGNSRWAIWATEAIALFATGLVFYRFLFDWLRRHWVSAVGVVSFLLVARSRFLSENGSFLTEGFALLPQAIVLAAGLKFLQSPRLRWCVVIGLASALAAMTRLTTIGITLAFIPALVMAGHPVTRHSKRWLWLGTMIASGLVGLGLFALYFWLNGALAEAFDAIFVFTEKWFRWAQGERVPLWTSLYRSLVVSNFRWLYVQTPLFIPGLVTAGYGLFSRRAAPPRRPTYQAISVWALLAFILDLTLVNLSGYSHEHYYITVTLSATALIVLGIHALVVEDAADERLSHASFVAWIWVIVTRLLNTYLVPLFGDNGYRVALLILLPFLGFLIWAGSPFLRKHLLAVSPYAVSAIVVLWFAGKFVEASPSNTLQAWAQPALQYEAAEYVIDHTQPGDRVFVWGAATYLNFQSGRFSPTAYHYAYPLVLPGYTERNLPQVMADLEENKPSLIVDYGGNDRIPPIDPQERERWRAAGRVDGGDVSAIFEFVEAHCELAERFEETYIYSCHY